MNFDQDLQGNDESNLSFHGLEMRGVNEVNAYPRANGGDNNPSEFELPTDAGVPIRVYVQQGKGTPVITFHDIGTNHNSLFPFFNCPEMRVLRQQLTIYHICAPGHHETAGPLVYERQTSREEGVSLLGGGSSEAEHQGQVFTIFGKTTQTISSDNINSESSTEYPSMDQLGDMVETVVDHFKLKYFLGFGVGAGSNVLTRYALYHPNKLIGLFLVNPVASASGYFLWFKNKWSDLPQLHKGIITNGIEQQLETHWFGHSQQNDQLIASLYLQQFHSLHSQNLAGYIQSFTNRTDLGITRPDPANSASHDSSLQVDTCLITGEWASDHCKLMAEMNGRMDPSKTTFISVPDTSGMLLEEQPEKVAFNFLHFLRTIGLAINVTPEKLREQSAKLQDEGLPRRSSEDPILFASGQV